MEKRKSAVKGSTLKWIAVVTMLIDHIAAVVFAHMMTTSMLDGSYYDVWVRVYYVMRGIGRLAFPIFCYLLVEGIRYTSNALRYGTRLFMFALLSEIPFNYAIYGTYLEKGKAHNVFFTLFLGFVAVELIKWIRQFVRANSISWLLVVILVAALFMLAAEGLDTDYGAYGILTIVLLYYLQQSWYGQRKGLAFLLAIVPLMISDTLEMTAVLDTYLIHKYDGTRGKQMKYFFYLFYPLHLLVLGLIVHYM